MRECMCVLIVALATNIVRYDCSKRNNVIVN